MTTTTPPKEAGPKGTPPKDATQAVDLREALEERYLAYALSTITGRALPDARDGLKPVQRRILHGMRLLRLDAGGPFKKSAKVVGDVMGSFHPHGDQAIYDALVRLAQGFAQRYPLVDGQGNFGNVDGDNAAAYRYTEARLTPAAALLLRGLDEDAVDFRPNYDGSTEEPSVLPAAFPNLLANGTQGIAVGMATSVPPHNAGELLDAAQHLIAHPEATARDLMAFVPGPDLPTGGVLVEPAEAIAEAYRTGRGGFRLRARWHREDTGRGTYLVVVTEVPYLVQKARLVERLAELVNDKKLPLLADVRDESAEDVRLVLEPRSRGVDPRVLMEALFRLCDLEVRLPLNMNVLVDGRVPRVLGLPAALRQWLDHRRDVLARRSRHRLAAIDRRLEVLGGLLIAYLNLDEVIRIIREEDEAKAALVARFALTEAQVTAVLDTRLRSLRRLEEMEIRRENDALTEERGELAALLDSEKAQWKRIGAEIKEARKVLGGDTPLGRRRTLIEAPPDLGGVDLEGAMVEREPVTVVISRMGWVRALKGHGLDLSALAFKGDDGPAHDFPCGSTDKVLVLASDGRVFTLEAGKLPGGRGFGDPLRLLVDLGEGAEVVAAWAHRPGERRLMALSDGRGFLALTDDLLSGTRKGRAVLVPEGDARAALAVPVAGDHLALVAANRRLLAFPMAQVPALARGKGQRLMRLRDAALLDARGFDLAAGLSWQDAAGRTHALDAAALAEWLGQRGDPGRPCPRTFPKTNRFG